MWTEIHEGICNGRKSEGKGEGRQVTVETGERSDRRHEEGEPVDINCREIKRLKNDLHTY